MCVSLQIFPSKEIEPFGPRQVARVQDLCYGIHFETWRFLVLFFSSEDVNVPTKTLMKFEFIIGGRRTNVQTRLVLAVPGACHHGDVVFRPDWQKSISPGGVWCLLRWTCCFRVMATVHVARRHTLISCKVTRITPSARLLPRVLAKRSYRQAHILSQVTVHHFKPGDECEHRGRPSGWFAVLAVFVAFAGLSLRCQGLKELPKPSVNAVDLARAVAIWNTCCFHWKVNFPFDMLRGKIDEAFWSDNPYLIVMMQYRFQSALEAWWTACPAWASSIKVLRVFSVLLLPGWLIIVKIVCWGLQTSHWLEITVEEGLYTIVTVFLVLRCTSPRMFGQRLLRKVGRQFLVSLFIGLCKPPLLFASSPINCIYSIVISPFKGNPIRCQAQQFARFSILLLFLLRIIYIIYSFLPIWLFQIGFCGYWLLRTSIGQFGWICKKFVWLESWGCSGLSFRGSYPQPLFFIGPTWLLGHSSRMPAIF